jgi:predicted acyltransferase
VPYPGRPAASYEQGANIVDYIDQHIMPGYLVSGNHDWEALGSTPPTVATVLLGALAGAWLLSARSVKLKLLGLCGGGLVLLALGRLWSLQFPITKQLWTSSYVLYAGGWSCLLLAVFYGIIDGLGWRRWSFPFILIGLNPLVIYILDQTGLINFPYITQFFLGWAFNHGGAKMHNSEITVGWIYPSVVTSAHPVWQILATIGIELLFLYWLYRRRIFWRV